MTCVYNEDELQDTVAWEFPEPVGAINIYENFLEAQIGGVVSAASVTLSRFLLSHPQFIGGKRCVELGSGCGMVSMVAKKLGAKSIQITEMAPLLSHCKADLDLNEIEALLKPLSWDDRAQFEQLEPYDIGLAAYCIYHLDAIEHFTSIIAAHADTSFLVCGISEPSGENVKHRLRDTVLCRFLQECEKHRLNLYLLSIEDIDPFKKPEEEEEKEITTSPVRRHARAKKGGRKRRRLMMLVRGL